MLGCYGGDQRRNRGASGRILAFVLRKMRDFGKVLSLRVTCLRFSNRVTAAFRIDAEWQGQKQGDQLGSQGRN